MADKYEEMDRDELKAAAEARNLKVSRKDGRTDLEPTVADYRRALTGAGVPGGRYKITHMFGMTAEVDLGNGRKAIRKVLVTTANADRYVPQLPDKTREKYLENGFIVDRQA